MRRQDHIEPPEHLTNDSSAAPILDYARPTQKDRPGTSPRVLVLAMAFSLIAIFLALSLGLIVITKIERSHWTLYTDEMRLLAAYGVLPTAGICGIKLVRRH